MAIRDNDLIIATDLDLATSALNTFSTSSIDLSSADNGVRNIGGGYQFGLEVEITESFTGFTALTNTPFLNIGIVMAGNAALTTTPMVLGWFGHPFVNQAEFGLQPSDSSEQPNLFKGQKYHLWIPPGVIGSPYLEAGGEGTSPRFVPAFAYLGAVFRNVCSTASALKPGAFTAADFSAGKLTARFVIRLTTDHGSEQYVTRMVAE